MKSGKTILLTSHYMEDISDLCSNVAFLSNTEIVESSKISDVIKKHSKNIIYLEDTSGTEHLYNLDVLQDKKDLCMHIMKGNVSRLHKNELSLKEIYYKILGGNP